MFATRIALFSGLINAAPCRFPASDPTMSGRLRNPKPTDGFLLRLPQSSQQHRRRKMEILAELGDSGVEPGSSGSPQSWKIKWLLGLMATIVLPLLTYKWGPPLKLTKEAEAKMEMVEEVVEAVEKVAEDVEKAAEDIVDKLPATGKLRAFVDAVANAADRISDGAEIVDDAIEGAEKVVEYVESKIEAAVGSEDDVAAAASAGNGKNEVKPEDDKAAVAAASVGEGKKEEKLEDDKAAAAASAGVGKNEVKPEDDKAAAAASAGEGKKELKTEDDKVAAAASAGVGKKEVKPVGASDQAIVES